MWMEILLVEIFLIFTVIKLHLLSHLIVAVKVKVSFISEKLIPLTYSK